MCGEGSFLPGIVVGYSAVRSQQEEGCHRKDVKREAPGYGRQIQTAADPHNRARYPRSRRKVPSALIKPFASRHGGH